MAKLIDSDKLLEELDKYAPARCNTLTKMIIEMQPAAVGFICDRRDERCNPCGYPNCKHTTDIAHAANFEKQGFGFLEIEKKGGV